MSEQIERELLLEATPEEVWAVVTADGWLADEVALDLQPGGDASFRSDEGEKSGWVEEVRAPHRLSFWWTTGDEPATRVELTLRRAQERTLLRVVETRPLELLDVLGIPLPGASGPSYGPALVAA
jgi:uncharacterized protein YndB with AHSA1/START domain